MKVNEIAKFLTWSVQLLILIVILVYPLMPYIKSNYPTFIPTFIPTLFTEKTDAFIILNIITVFVAIYSGYFIHKLLELCANNINKYEYKASSLIAIHFYNAVFAAILGLLWGFIGMLIYEGSSFAISAAYLFICMIIIGSIVVGTGKMIDYDKFVEYMNDKTRKNACIPWFSPPTINTPLSWARMAMGLLSIFYMVILATR